MGAPSLSTSIHTSKYYRYVSTRVGTLQYTLLGMYVAAVFCSLVLPLLVAPMAVGLPDALLRPVASARF